MTRLSLALARYTTGVLRARAEYARDPFAASRILAYGQINGEVLHGRVNPEAAAGLRAEIAGWSA